MSDKLQMIVPIDNWKYVIDASIMEDGNAFLNIHSCCIKECSQFESNECDEKCPHDFLKDIVFDSYEERVLRALKAAAKELYE
jgi:hypothetical protein